MRKLGILTGHGSADRIAAQTAFSAYRSVSAASRSAFAGRRSVPAALLRHDENRCDLAVFDAFDLAIVVVCRQKRLDLFDFR
jgi:hypothetical protein